MSSDQAVNAAVAFWQSMLSSRGGWVVFSHGTCFVMPAEDDGDLVECATAAMRSAEITLGSPSADFHVDTLREGRGWLVSYDPDAAPGLVNYVQPGEVSIPAEDEMERVRIVGQCGRAKRGADAADPQIEYIAPVRAQERPQGVLAWLLRKIGFRRSV